MRGARDILTGGASVIHARIIRVKGSSPREEGAEMFITAMGLAGTIGGGQAEWHAVQRARDMLATGDLRDTLDIALGPEIGQCCGGRITVELQRLGESQRAAHLDRIESAALPHLLILGAGHVGRALARIALTLPWRVIVVDTRADELALAPAGAETRLTPARGRNCLCPACQCLCGHNPRSWAGFPADTGRAATSRCRLCRADRVGHETRAV